MFQTDFHVWLQGLFDAGWMLPLMTGISTLGYAPAYLLLIAICAFGVRLRGGLSVMLTVLLMAGATSVVKHTIDLPRPSDVDARVLDKGRSGHALVVAEAAPGFWSLPSDAGIAAYRAQDGERDPGFLSGHVGVASAAALSMVLGLRISGVGWRVLLVLGWPLLMAISRMYLGRHFVADVLAGWAVGLAVAALAWWLMPRPVDTGLDRWRLAVIGLLAATWVAIASLSRWIPVDSAGQLAGLFVMLLVLQLRGWPADPVGWRRVGGPLLFLALNLLAGPLIETVALRLPLPDTRAVGVLWYFIGTALVMLLMLLMLRRLDRLQMGRAGP